MSSESTFEEMMRYVRFGAEDARLLSRFRPAAAPHFRRIAEEFYDRIREHQDAHAVFTGEEQIQRLQRSLVRWMERICQGPHDEAYFQEAVKIGQVHVRIGLPQRYMFTAMSLIRIALERIADEAMGPDGSVTREAISRALDLELAIMVEAYRDDYIARLQKVERGEKQEAFRTLRRTEHRYVNAVELAKVLVVGLDQGGDVRLFNREAERVTGFARDQMLGRPFIDALSDSALRDEHGPIIEQAAAGAHVPRDVIEGVVRTRAGKLRDVRWQLAYAPSDGDVDDDVVLFVIGRDITDENALAARLRQNEKLAAVGTLAAGLAHEIRNPLNGAQLHVTFLERSLREGPDEEALEAVRVISGEIQRLSDLVTEFLAFARPKPLDRRETSLRELCDRVIQLMGPVAAAAKVNLELHPPATNLVLEIDLAKMEQVLLNLVQNAIEALEPDGGSVRVRARRRPRHAIIEVEDNGPGLPGPDAPVFDPFFSTKSSGTGLGLAIAHRIVNDHDGAIEVESRPGKTTFRIVLPI